MNASPGDGLPELPNETHICPRCEAAFASRRVADMYGAYIQCLVCAHHIDLPHERLLADVQQTLRDEHARQALSSIRLARKAGLIHQGERVLTALQAAEELGVGTTTCYQWLLAGRVRNAHRLAGQRWVIVAPDDGPPVLDPPLTERESEALRSRQTRLGTGPRDTFGRMRIE